jgi:hypothetical protein
MMFSKGRYFIDDEEVAPDREFVAHVGSFARGYVRFQDGKLTDQRIVKVTDGPEPNRTDLGDTDATKWERDSKGEPQDPWSRQVYLPIEDLQTGEVFVFVSGSQGGRGAVGALCTLAGRNLHRGSQSSSSPFRVTSTSRLGGSTSQNFR